MTVTAASYSRGHSGRGVAGMGLSDEMQTSRSAAAQTTRCLVSPPAALLAAPTLVEAATSALRDHDVDTARCQLRTIDRTALWTHWFAAGIECTRRYRPQPSHGGARSAAVPTKAVTRSVYERDGWRCRYCDLKVIDPALLRALGTVLPADFPWTDRNASSHPAGLLLAATPEHVVPRSIGGDNTPDNLVTACGTCQYNKGACTIDELCLADPRDTPPAGDGWRGLTESVASITAMDPLPPGSGSAPPVDVELEYLIAYGQTTGQLPAIKQLDLVAKLVRIYGSTLRRNARQPRALGAVGPASSGQGRSTAS